MIILGSETQPKQLVNTTSQKSLINYSLAPEGEEFIKNFEADDIIDWQLVGKPLTPLPTTFLMTSNCGATIQVSVNSGSSVRLDQTPVLGTSFEIGDALLFTGFGNPGPLTIAFENSIFAISTQIQSDTSQVTEYLVSVEAFDNLDKSLGKVKLPGLSQQAGGGTIPLSLFDGRGRIKKLVFNAKEQGIHMPFAINSIKMKAGLK
jgi:hypothetical protein